LADGSTYGHEGTIYFADRQVIRAPGQFESPDYSPILETFCAPAGTAKFARFVRIQQDALLVPQRAVSELQGGYQVAAIDGENKVSIRAVQVGDRVGTKLDCHRRTETR